MPFRVINLIEGRGLPVAALSSDSVQDALAIMIEQDFSQLPVINDYRIVQGLITSESIVRALNNFDVTTKSLRVSDALVRSPYYRAEDDLFDLLKGLRDHYAVVIVDSEDRLIGIVTSYDTTEFFRRRSEDMMIVEDIETTLKDLVLASFLNDSGETDKEALASAIEDVTSSRDDQRRFRQALARCFELNGIAQKPGEESVQDSFSILKGQKSPKSFNQLSLNEYVGLFLHKNRWPLYSSLFSLDSAAIRGMLKAVCEVRNTLAHFNGEISIRQRQLLRFCADWLARYQPELQSRAVNNRAPTSNKDSKQSGSDKSVHLGDSNDRSGKSTSLNDSRYAPLALWLQRLPLGHDKVTFTFKELEEVIGDTLPESARRHRAWWANEENGHSQSQQWLSVGWQVSSISIPDEQVEFARIKEWEAAYARFFSALLTDLGQTGRFSTKMPLPDGASWIKVASFPDQGPQIAAFAFSFVRSEQFRAELYVDTGDKEKNKHIFSQLAARKSLIESALEEPLSWERINYNRPFGQNYLPVSRVALYHKGCITDSEAELSELRKWAVDAMTKLSIAMVPHIAAVTSTQQ